MDMNILFLIFYFLIWLFLYTIFLSLFPDFFLSATIDTKIIFFSDEVETKEEVAPTEGKEWILGFTGRHKVLKSF